MRRSALVVNVAELLRRPGSRREVQAEAELGGVQVVDTEVPPRSPVAVDLVLTSMPEGVVATGTVTAPWRSVCRRCAEEVAGELRTEVREVFQVRPTDPEACWPIEGEVVDLAPMVREVVLLELPMAPEHPVDPEHGPCEPPPLEALDEDEEVEVPDEVPRDPRWAALDALRSAGAEGETGGSAE